MTWVVAKRAARIFAGDEPLIVPSLHVRESNRADMKPWNASACNSSQFMIAIYRVTCRNLDLESTGRSFFNCDVRFAAKEFSKGKEGVRDSKPRSCGGKRVDRERGFTSVSI